jgi:hypothetical protein
LTTDIDIDTDTNTDSSGINYWQLENPDLFISKIAKERTIIIMNEFHKFVEKYLKGSYDDVHNNKGQELLFKKSDQRIDLLINVYQEILKQYSGKLTELQCEVEKRRKKKNKGGQN